MKSFMLLKDDPIWQDPRPWLVAGAGPSLDGWSQELRDKYRVMAIHKAALVTDPDVVLFMDWDKVKEVDSRVDVRRVLINTGTHRQYYPRETLEWALWNKIPYIAACDHFGDMYVFRTQNQPEDAEIAGPAVEFRSACGEVAIDILGQLGVKDITTIGIDGGGGASKVSDDPGVEENLYGDLETNGVLDAVKRHDMNWTRL